jgi:hypothetical protein
MVRTGSIALERETLWHREVRRGLHGQTRTRDMRPTHHEKVRWDRRVLRFLIARTKRQVTPRDNRRFWQ